MIALKITQSYKWVFSERLKLSGDEAIVLTYSG